MGLTTAVATNVAGVPGRVIGFFHPRATPVSIVGTAGPGLRPTSTDPVITNAAGQSDGIDPCSLVGEYIVPGPVNIGKTITTSALAHLLSHAADAGETGGMYVLQTTTGQTALLTGIRPILLTRLPTPSTETEVDVDPAGCPAPDVGDSYEVDINLDAPNLTPKVYNDTTSTSTLVTNLADVITHDSPVEINFSASATRYEAVWELQFNYTVDGSPKSSLVNANGSPFMTDAVRPGTRVITLYMSSNPLSDSWTVSTGQNTSS